MAKHYLFVNKKAAWIGGKSGRPVAQVQSFEGFLDQNHILFLPKIIAKLILI
jgi:hypothetical protein